MVRRQPHPPLPLISRLNDLELLSSGHHAVNAILVRRMAKEAPLYDLVLLLSPTAEDNVREKILSDVETTITGAGGSIERNDTWGRRPMAFEIRHQPEAEYHLLQFRAPGSLIEELSHTLRITDGVVRHRVIKVRPGTPEAPSSVPVVATAASGHGGAAADSPAES